MEVVRFSLKCELVKCLVRLANRKKHSQLFSTDLERDCGQALKPHREFSDTYIECRHSVFSSQE